jgi:hypothetical protein
MKYKVKIKKCSTRFGWYKNKIGSIYVVDRDFCVIDSNLISKHIQEKDCEILAVSKLVWVDYEDYKK